MGHLEKVLPQMTHPPEFTFRIIALSLVVDRRTLFLAVMVLGYLRSYFGRGHAPRRAVTPRKNFHLTTKTELLRLCSISISPNALFANRAMAL